METTPGQKQDFTLQEFLIKPKTDYTELIKKTEKDSKAEEWINSGLDTSYGSSVAEGLTDSPHIFETGNTTTEEVEKIFLTLKERVRGKILVDLGSGTNNSMERLAEALEASVYVKIDKFFLNPKLINPTEIVRTKQGMQITGAISDMLDFLSKLPDNSVCLTINGIDGLVIRNNEYHEALVREIVRVLVAGGAVFGTNSDCLSNIYNTLISKGANEDISEQTKNMILKSSVKIAEFREMAVSHPFIEFEKE